jgi:hypothetical protein
MITVFVCLALNVSVMLAGEDLLAAQSYAKTTAASQMANACRMLLVDALKLGLEKAVQIPDVLEMATVLAGAFVYLGFVIADLNSPAPVARILFALISAVAVDGVIQLRNIVNATRVTTALTVLIPIASTTVLATALATHLDFVSVTTAGLVWIAQYHYAAGALVTVLARVTAIAFVISLGLGRIVPFACVLMVAAAMELVSTEHAFVTLDGLRMIVRLPFVRQF